MKLVPVALGKCLRLINHGPLVIVTTAEGGRVNAAPVQWNMPVNDEPPTVALALDGKNFSRELIRRTGVFVMNVPDPRFLPAIQAWGSRSGWEGDKITEMGAAFLPGERVDVPHLADALGFLECRVTQTVAIEGVDLVLGEVVCAGADPRFFVDNRWADHVQTLHHLGGGTFALAGERRSSSL